MGNSEKMPKKRVSWINQTKSLLAKSKLSVKDVAEGAQVSRPWVYKLQDDVVPNVRVRELQRAHDFLADYVEKKTRKRK